MQTLWDLTNAVNGMIGRDGGGRKDKLLNRACALYALRLPTLANRNKRNKAATGSRPRYGRHHFCLLPARALEPAMQLPYNERHTGGMVSRSCLAVDRDRVSARWRSRIGRRWAGGAAASAT
jgi:hypothetical protein